MRLPEEIHEAARTLHTAVRVAYERDLPIKHDLGAVELELADLINDWYEDEDDELDQSY